MVARVLLDENRTVGRRRAYRFRIVSTQLLRRNMSCLADGIANGGGSSTQIVPFDTLDQKVKELIQRAVQARENAYVPYSKFPVGACVETSDGHLFSGCNVENASFTVGTCAERCALFTAVSNGHQSFKRVAVAAYQANFLTTPCGACRQMMSEFGDYPVYITKPQMDQVLVSSVRELLPFSFQINADHTF